MRRLLLAVLLVGSLWTASSASATFPGANGKIVFSSGPPTYVYPGEDAGNPDDRFDIFSVNPDGTGEQQLTRTPFGEVYPTWSPDGTRIALQAYYPVNGTHPFRRNDEVFVMNADGSAETNLTNTTARYGCEDPSCGLDYTPSCWSPDGTKIVFDHSGWFDTGFYIMNADGSGKYLFESSVQGGSPDWSPDGSWITFEGGLGDIHTVKPDGTGLKNLTNSPCTYAGNDPNPCLRDTAPSWSPDGTKIAFASDSVEPQKSGDTSQVFVMNADGTGLRQLTNDGATNRNPVWSPDGTRIAFDTNRNDPNHSFGCPFLGCNKDIYVMNADGTMETAITKDTSVDFAPDWQPVASHKNFAKACKAQRNVDESAFQRRYGNGANAFGKCVSAKNR